MSESRAVFLFGYSGHAYVIIESLFDAGYTVNGYFDLKKVSKNPYNLTYLGSEKEADLKQIVGADLVFPSVGENLVRRKLVSIFENLGLKQFVAIDPTAQVSKTALVNNSTYIGKGATVNAQAVIGKGVILNTASIVEHECMIADYVHIAPGAVLCGNVSVGESSFVGANSVVKQNIKLKSDIVIGAGSVVTADLNEKGVWVGNKLRKL